MKSMVALMEKAQCCSRGKDCTSRLTKKKNKHKQTTTKTQPGKNTESLKEIGTCVGRGALNYFNRLSRGEVIPSIKPLNNFKMHKEEKFQPEGAFYHNTTSAPAA